MKKEQIPAIHAFRAFAIISVVAIHAFEFAFYYAGQSTGALHPWIPFVQKVNAMLFHSSTLYFALISGILFSLILSNRGWKQFFISKISYVALPYLIFTCLFTWRHYAFSGELTYFDNGIARYIESVTNNLYTGGALFTFWYIPILLVLYLGTPVIASLLKHKQGKWPTRLVILLPLVISRVWPELSWTNYVYFFGAYTLGMLAGSHYPEAIRFIQRNHRTICLAAFGSSALILVLMMLDIQHLTITDLQESAWYVQKISISALVLYWFERKLTRIPVWLGILGDYTFTLYFIHAYLLFALYDFFFTRGAVLNGLVATLIFSILTLVATLLACTAITYSLKAIFGKSSKYIIGA